MKTYANLDEVLKNIDQMSWEGTLFTNKEAWRSSSREAKLFI